MAYHISWDMWCQSHPCLEKQQGYYSTDSWEDMRVQIPFTRILIWKWTYLLTTKPHTSTLLRLEDTPLSSINADTVNFFDSLVIRPNRVIALGRSSRQHQAPAQWWWMFQSTRTWIIEFQLNSDTVQLPSWQGLAYADCISCRVVIPP